MLRKLTKTKTTEAAFTALKSKQVNGSKGRKVWKNTRDG